MSKPRFTIKGWHVLAAILVFFGIDFAVNGYFAYAATKTFPGESFHQPYAQGIHYNDELKLRAAQRALGWAVRYNAYRTDDGALTVVVKIVDRNAAPLDGLEVGGILRRRGDADADRKIVLAGQGGGIYRVRLEDVPVGRWFLDGKARDGAGHAFAFKSATWLR